MQRENRRLAAIVAADIAGYARLIGQDEEGTLRALRAHRQELIDRLIDEHGGRIANTAGDSLLLEFPSTVDAMRSALAVQEGMAERNRDVEADHQIRFRIGINVGDVIAEGDDLLGDEVNVAARLQEIAEPGGICISRRAHEDVQDRLDTVFDDLGEQSFKSGFEGHRPTPRAAPSDFEGGSRNGCGRSGPMRRPASRPSGTVQKKRKAGIEAGRNLRINPAPARPRPAAAASRSRGRD